ncbi:hypothetical protein [Labrys monachus]|uniref:Uncharacterized protein n=1 Tax=Labrys monachus TaxID=217067 RepID=A0ABU0FMN2_9HYPH|nr:hypothetical protein [Labrys monachus]MDQ0395384.1 hypothetical protein [Labrys monachus]
MTEIEITRRQSDSLIVRLWRGDVPLAVTYWVFGVVVGAILRLALPGVTYLVFANAKNLSNFDVSAILYLAWGVVSAYFIFVFVAIWRSAAKYAKLKPDKKGRAILAQIVVFLGFVSFVSNVGIQMSRDSRKALTTESSSSPDEKMQYQAMMAGLNSDLPKMIDAVTRLNKINIDRDGIQYYETITVPVTDKDGFLNRLKVSVSNSLCKSNANTLDLMRNGSTFRYYYLDSDNRLIGSLAVTEHDCPS